MKSTVSVAATSLKLPKALKSRITRLAKRAGESSHAFMLRLLEEQVQAEERFEAFAAEARQADRQMREAGLGYLASDVRDYLKARVVGARATRPKPVRWRK